MGAVFRWIRQLFLAEVSGTLGKRVNRAAALIPQTATEAIFNVVGGNVLITSLIGEVTVLIGDVVNTFQLQINPTAGAAVVLDDGAYNPQANAVGIMVTPTGNPADILQAGLSLAGGLAGGLLLTGINTHGWIAPPGAIELTTSADSVTGQMKWQVHYVPLDAGAVVQAA
ncbi:hypothetical protein ES705_46599 [subsurface metagenome]